MIETILAMAAWATLTVALNRAVRRFEYPKGYRVSPSTDEALLGPENGNGSRSGGDSW